MPKPAPKGNRYQVLIEKVFFDHYTSGATEVKFERDELIAAAKKLKVELPKNVGDHSHMPMMVSRLRIHSR